MKNISKIVGYLSLAVICIAILYFTHSVNSTITLAIIGFLFISESD